MARNARLASDQDNLQIICENVELNVTVLQRFQYQSTVLYVYRLATMVDLKRGYFYAQWVGPGCHGSPISGGRTVGTV